MTCAGGTTLPALETASSSRGAAAGRDVGILFGSPDLASLLQGKPEQLPQPGAVQGGLRGEDGRDIILIIAIIIIIIITILCVPAAPSYLQQPQGGALHAGPQLRTVPAEDTEVLLRPGQRSVPQVNTEPAVAKPLP